jgi:hypothetical protein
MLDLIPGFIQGIVRVLVSYPFDYIRTNIQTQEFKNVVDFYKKTNMSVNKLYNGVSIPLITIPIDRAIQFYIFEECNKRKYSLFQSSLIATLLSSIYSVPINYMQTIIMTKNSINIVNKNKIIGYNGFYSDLSRNIASSFLYLGIYGKLREIIPKEKHNYFLFGVTASSVMWSIVYPLDTIRVLKQTSDSSYIKIIKNTHIRNYYRGLPIVILRSMPSSGFGMMAYEFTKKKIEQYKDNLS